MMVRRLRVVRMVIAFFDLIRQWGNDERAFLLAFDLSELNGAPEALQDKRAPTPVSIPGAGAWHNAPLREARHANPEGLSAWSILGARVRHFPCGVPGALSSPIAIAIHSRAIWNSCSRKSGSCTIRASRTHSRA